MYLSFKCFTVNLKNIRNAISESVAATLWHLYVCITAPLELHQQGGILFLSPCGGGALTLRGPIPIPIPTNPQSLS